MTRSLIAAQSGWGKSFFALAYVVNNLADYDAAVILDYKDEFRGIAEEGMADWLIGGPAERDAGREWWDQALRESDALVVCRHSSMAPEDWRALAATAIEAAREYDGKTLTWAEEAHFIAPQRGSYPEVIRGLATTGRGELAHSVWSTQRFAEIDKTVATQADERILGGFDGDNIDRVSSVVSGYPADIHDPQANVPAERVPDALVADDGHTTVRQFEDDAGKTIGSEWIYSTQSGDRRRVDTRGLDAGVPHYSPDDDGMDLPT
ncbi:MAG: ATP-binding protein [Haloferacaceae archaeon]